jgi:putative aminopeptidase FrvX
MKTNVKLLAQICEVAGAPGHEQRVREIVLKKIIIP